MRFDLGMNVIASDWRGQGIGRACPKRVGRQFAGKDARLLNPDGERVKVSRKCMSAR